MHAVCEQVHRGVKFDENVTITDDSQLPDFRLVPKEFESKYTFAKTASQRIAENVFPQYVECPPLLKNILIKNGVKDPKLKTVLREHINSLYRVAKDGEQPTKQLNTGFGKPKSPNLYKHVNYDI